MKSRFAVFVSLVFFSCGVFAQTYPAKPLRLIVSDGTGSVADMRARQLGVKLTEFLGQAVVIDNRPGGNMIIGAEAAARAPADGHTLFLGNCVTHVNNPMLFRNLPYRPEEDFVPVTALSAGPLIFAVNAQLPAGNLAELVALGKTRPGQIAYGAVGRGGAAHLLMEQVKSVTGADFNLVPYKSLGTALQDVVAGHLPVFPYYWSSLLPHVKSGKVKALAVAATRRLAAAPDIPTTAEAGFPGIEGGCWQGIFVPTGTPKPVIARLREEIARVLNLPEIRNQLIETGAEVGGNTPEEFAAFIRADRVRSKKIYEVAGITPE